MEQRSSYSKNRTVDFIKNTKAGIPSQLQHYPFGVSDSVPDPVPNPQPTVFFRDSYEAFDQYPQGVADIVGAESRLFGGASYLTVGRVTQMYVYFSAYHTKAH